MRQRLGRITEAATNFRKALALIQESKSPDAFELARTHALHAGIAADPASGMTAADGESQAEEAVKALRRYIAGQHATVREAAEAGYVDVNFIDKHFQLDSLRRRPDYKQLLREMSGQPAANRP